MNNPLTLYSQAYTGLSKQTWWLSLVMLVNRSGTMVIPFMTLYLTQYRHYTIVQAGYVMGIYGMGSITGALLGGKLTDSIGFYKVQLIALCAGGVMFIVLGFMTSFWHICLSAFLLSLVNEAFRPANSAAIAAYSTPKNVTRSFSLNRLSINLGWATGGALGGLVAAYDFSLLFWIDGITNISAAIFLLLFIPYKTVKARRLSNEEQAGHSPILSAYKDKLFLYFILLTTVFAICFFQLFTLLPVFYKENLQLSVAFIGILMAINGVLLASLEMVLVYNLEGKRKNTLYISGGVLLVGLSYMMLNFSIIPAVWLAFTSTILITFGEMLAVPFMNSFWISRTNVQNRGQYASLYTIPFALAQIIAPAIGSQIVKIAGFASLWWVIGGLSCINSLLFIYMKTGAELPEIQVSAK